MNRVILGILCGIVFGLLDAAMVIFGKHPDKSLAMLLQAFFSRFAILICDCAFTGRDAAEHASIACYPQQQHSAVRDRGEVPCHRVRAIAEHKLQEVKQQINDLLGMRDHPKALKAIHEFLRFQIAEHQTGDSTEIADDATQQVR